MDQKLRTDNRFATLFAQWTTTILPQNNIYVSLKLGLRKVRYSFTFWNSIAKKQVTVLENIKVERELL